MNSLSPTVSLIVCSIVQACHFSGFVFTKKKKKIERREVATKGKKTEVAGLCCFQTSSFLFVGMWRVCKSSKIKHPGGLGALSSRPKGDPVVLPIFHESFTVKSHP